MRIRWGAVLCLIAGISSTTAHSDDAAGPYVREQRTVEVRLHALASVARPDTPLIMPLGAWQALLRDRGPSAVATWRCGDHGSETRTELVVSASDGAIAVKSREFSCPSDGSVEQLIRESDE